MKKDYLVLKGSKNVQLKDFRRGEKVSNKILQDGQKKRNLKIKPFNIQFIEP